MEIALNKESKRKSAVAVALRGEERSFGSDALAVGVKHPQNCYFYLLDLVGKPFDHPAVKLYQDRFPFYNLEAVGTTPKFALNTHTISSQQNAMV